MSPSCCNDGAAAGSIPLLEQLAAKAADACPWLLVGLLSSVALQSANLPVERLRYWLSGSKGGAAPSHWVFALRCSLASLLGLATPLCSCGAFPVALSLAAQGVSPAAVVAATLVGSINSFVIIMGILRRLAHFTWPFPFCLLCFSIPIVRLLRFWIQHFSPVIIFY